MNDIHFLKDGCSIISDESLSSGVLDHFVHTSGTKTGSNTVSDGYDKEIEYIWRLGCWWF